MKLLNNQKFCLLIVLIFSTSFSIQSTSAQEIIEDTVRMVERELLNLDPNLETECYERLQQHLIDEKVACIKRVNQSFLDRGVSRLSSEISEIDQKIQGLLTDERLKSYPFYEWKIQALKIKKEEGAFYGMAA